MDRRQFLATGATLAAAVTGGCVGCATAPTLSLSIEETSDRDIADRLTKSLVPDENPDHQIGIDAVEDGSMTVQDVAEPFDPDLPYAYDDAVYVADVTVVDEIPGTSSSYSMNPVDEDETIASENAIPYEELPEVDRDAFGRGGWDTPDPFLGYRTSAHFLDEDIEESVIVSEPKYEVIVWPETRGHIEIDRQVEQPLKTYEYTADLVVEPVAEYGRQVRELVEFELGPLDDEAADVVSAAIDDPPYTVPHEGDLSAAEERIVDEFDGRDRVRRLSEPPRDADGPTGRYIVRYEGQIYWAEIGISRS